MGSATVSQTGPHRKYLSAYKTVHKPSNGLDAVLVVVCGFESKTQEAKACLIRLLSLQCSTLASSLTSRVLLSRRTLSFGRDYIAIAS